MAREAEVQGTLFFKLFSPQQLVRYNELSLLVAQRELTVAKREDFSDSSNSRG